VYDVIQSLVSALKTTTFEVILLRHLYYLLLITYYKMRAEHQMVATNMKFLLELLPLRGPIDFYTPEVEAALLAPLEQ
jgi:hypothetical protein